MLNLKKLSSFFFFFFFFEVLLLRMTITSDENERNNAHRHLFFSLVAYKECLRSWWSSVWHHYTVGGCTFLVF